MAFIVQRSSGNKNSQFETHIKLNHIGSNTYKKKKKKKKKHMIDNSYIKIPTRYLRSPGTANALPPASASIFTLKCFKSPYFPNHMMDLVKIWRDDRRRSKDLMSINPPMPVALRSRTLAFILKICVKAYIFQTIRIIWFIFGMMTDMSKN